ncbi:odorant receptor 49b-like isoform X2 [Cylas formicarius]|uniref:odorant receptor 49b-like isoform X2 n=1 Tax=Cylas formicarius TaxID=197179 RepID=UPI0029584AEC|nr:odorant receptor 49b-like isoform X2 [Cylas formicarius]
MPRAKSYFSYIRRLMMIIGIWRIQNGEELSTKEKRLYHIYAATFQVISTSGGLSVLLEIPTLIKRTSVFSVPVLDNVSRVTMYGLIVFKMVMWRSKRMFDLLNIALEYDSQLAVHADPKIKEIYKQYLDYGDTVISIIFLSGVLIGFGIGIIGDINCYKYFMENKGRNVSGNPLPLNLWYPFDKNKYYTMVLVDQNIRPTMCCLCIGVVGASVNSVVVFLTLQLKLLQYYFRNADTFRIDDEVFEDIVERNLKLLCVKHQELIAFAEELRQTLKNIILIEYAVSSASIAILILQTIASSGLADALYQSNWYDQTKSTKAILHVMMMRCQKPIRLTIGMFGAMDLEAGVSRLKLGYTYTTLVHN